MNNYYFKWLIRFTVWVLILCTIESGYQFYKNVRLDYLKIQLFQVAIDKANTILPSATEEERRRTYNDLIQLLGGQISTSDYKIEIGKK